MRHRQSANHGLVAGDIDHHAAASAVFAPAIDHVGGPDRGNEGRASFFHRQAVQMTAVLGGQLAQKRRAPQRLETVRLADGGQAAEQGIDEDQLAVGIDRHVVDIEVARGVADLRQVKRVVAVLGFALGEQVLETPDLVQAAHPQPVGCCAQTHAAIEAALECGEFAIALQAQKEQLADLVGGQRDGKLLLGQPGKELARGGDFEVPGWGGNGAGRGSFRRFQCGGVHVVSVQE